MATGAAEQTQTPLLIGISLGTVYSCIAIIDKDNKNASVIANEDGDRQIPSYVAFTQHETLCGTQAAHQAMANPRGTIFHFRNILGKKFSDDEVKLQSQKHPFSIVHAPGNESKPAYEVTPTDDEGNDKTTVHTVVSVAAHYFQKIKETAEYFLGKKVDGCVISIPAHFEDEQKKDLLSAVKEAGFEIAYPIHEPVAAALAFDAASEQQRQSQIIPAETQGSAADKQICVLDLGAHQFNVTILSNHDGLYTIEASIEEPDLGGIAFNEILVDFIRQEFKRKTKADVGDNRRAMQKLRNACERTKRALTRQDTAPCSVESLYDGMDYNGNVNRGRFELLAEPLFKKCQETVMRALREAKIRLDEIDEVLVVGGSSRMPRFMTTMKSLFSERVAFRADVEPDEAIALGCAVQAGVILSSMMDYGSLSVHQDVMTADHLSRSIGIEIAGGDYAVLIPKGTPIPVRRSFLFGLSDKNQTEAYLAIYEGESAKAQNNSILAEAVLSDLPETTGGRGSNAIQVVLIVEKDQSLTISASEKVSGQKVRVRVK